MATFDENGNYIKTDWKAGDKITATKLNKIEESIEAVNNNDISRHVEADARLDKLESGTASDKQAINAKVDALEDVVEANKDAADIAIYDINAHMTLLDKKIDDGVAEVEAIAETVDGKIAAAETNMNNKITAAETNMNNQISQAETNMQNQVNQGKADMEAMVADINSIMQFDRALYLSNLHLTSNVSETINSALLTSGIDTVIIPKGSYVLTETIDIPAGKTLQLQGMFDDVNSYAPETNKFTVLKPAAGLNIMIMLHSYSKLIGGFLNLDEYPGKCVAVQMNFYNENCEYAEIDGTTIRGDRNYEHTGVYMECDDPDGVIKNGYGVYINLNTAMYGMNIGYHLHRLNATWDDGPEDIVWCTAFKIEGRMEHCNRYLWYETVGGWAGDTTRMSTIIQAGVIVGEDHPAIEVSCDSFMFDGDLWDFGVSGLQQTKAYLTDRSRNCSFLKEKRLNAIDRGTNNIFASDLDTVIANSHHIINSYENRIDELDIKFTVDGNIYDYADYTWQHPFGTFGFSGIYNVQNLFGNQHRDGQYMNATAFEGYEQASIEISFKYLTSVDKIGFTLHENLYPRTMTVEVYTRDNEWLVASEYDFSNITIYNWPTPYNEFIIDLASLLEKSSLYAKQRVLQKIKITMNGVLTINSMNMFGISDIKIQHCTPFAKPMPKRYSYNYDTLNGVPYNFDGNKLLGEPEVDMDFTIYTGDIETVSQYIGMDNNCVSLSLVDGALRVTLNDSIGAVYIKGARKLAYVEFNNPLLTNGFYTICSFLGGTLSSMHAYKIKSFIFNGVLFEKSSAYTVGDYIDIKRLTIYPLTSLPKNVDYIEIYNVLNRID